MPFPHGTLHHVELYVSDLERSRRFYDWLLKEELGYTLFQKWDHGVSYKLGETYIVFVQTESAHLADGYHRKRTGLNHLAFRVRDRMAVDKLTETCRQQQIPILYEDRHPFAGGPDYYALYIEDPDRIKLEFVAAE